MKKTLLMLLVALLLPIVASAQYVGYNPAAHNPDNQARIWSDIQDFFSGLFSSSSSTAHPHTTGGAGYVPPVSSSSLQEFQEWCEDCQKNTPHVHPHTTGGAGYVPPVSSSSLQEFQEWCEDCQKNTPHVHPHTTGGAGYVPSLPSSFYGAVDRANKDAASEAQKEERTFSSPWGSVYTQTQIYGYCLGILEGYYAINGPIEFEKAREALTNCDKAVDVLSGTMKSCPNPETVAPAKEAGKNWWQKNVVAPYIQGNESVAASYTI